jgi:hypothetical protein
VYQHHNIELALNNLGIFGCCLFQSVECIDRLGYRCLCLAAPCQEPCILNWFVTGNQKYSENGNERALKMGTRIQQNREQEYSDKLTEY